MNSTKLGGFEYENSGNDVYILRNGICRFNGKWEKRGIGNLGNRQMANATDKKHRIRLKDYACAKN